jgi:hypothetical protein
MSAAAAAAVARILKGKFGHKETASAIYTMQKIWLYWRNCKASLQPMNPIPISKLR